MVGTPDRVVLQINGCNGRLLFATLVKAAAPARGDRATIK